MILSIHPVRRDVAIRVADSADWSVRVHCDPMGGFAISWIASIHVILPRSLLYHILSTWVDTCESSYRSTLSMAACFGLSRLLSSLLPQATRSLLPCTPRSFALTVNIKHKHTLCTPQIPRLTSSVLKLERPTYVPTPNSCRQRAVPISIADDDNKNQSHNSTPDVDDGMSPAIDFQALRREREERQQQMSKKRERSISPPPTKRESNKAPRLDSTTVALPSGAKITSFSSTVSKDQQARKSDIASIANEGLHTSSATVVGDHSAVPAPAHQPKISPGGLLYPKGVVKKTWAFGHERTGKDIKLEEVLESQTLKTAVISAFQWDMDWLFRKINVQQTKCIFVMQAKEQALKDEMLDQTKDMQNFLRLCFPSMEGLINCMHSKLMLLFHPEKLRIAIPTANLLEFDWGESGVMENSVWLIDLPRLPKKTTANDLTDFGKELMFFTEKQGVPQDARDGLLTFDFSATKNMAFVHTVGGMLYGDEAQRTGLPGLSQAVRRLNLVTSEDDLDIDFAASSMGSLKDEFLKNVHAAASGLDMIERAGAANSKAKSNFFQAKRPNADNHSIRDRIRLYFPTHETVTSSTAGGAGTICLSRKWFEDMTFPRRCFRDYISTRPGMLSHNKILYARGLQRTEAETDVKKIAWAYVGSANMSESAWGKLIYDRKEKKWKVNCKNWECGVLLPVSTEGAKTEAGADGIVDMEVFKDVVEPPFMYPGLEYEDREPWYFMEKH